MIRSNGRTWRESESEYRALAEFESEDQSRGGRGGKDDPVAIAAFRRIVLNLGVSDVTRSELVDAATWKQCETVNPPIRSGIQILGIDLGSGAAMSAAAAYWPHCEGGGRLEVIAAFPRRPDFAERGRKDHIGNLYSIMQQREELVLCGDLVVSVEELLGEALDRFGKPDVIVADRWREHELTASVGRYPISAGGADIPWRRGIVTAAKMSVYSVAPASASVSTRPRI